MNDSSQDNFVYKMRLSQGTHCKSHPWWRGYHVKSSKPFTIGVGGIYSYSLGYTAPREF